MQHENIFNIALYCAFLKQTLHKNNLIMKNIFFKISFALFVILFSFASCYKSYNGSVPKTNMAFYIGSTQVSKANLFIDNAILNGNSMTFNDYTGYLKTLQAGSSEIRLTPPGATNHFFKDKLFFDADKYYSVFFYDMANEVHALHVEDMHQKPSVGMSRLRMVHLSADASALDVKISGDVAIFANMSYTDVSSFIELPAGMYNFNINENQTGDLLNVTQPLYLSEGRTYTLVVSGLMAASGNTAFKAHLLLNE